MYSQNSEEAYILNYFKGHTGTLLDIGANDGKTFSNSLALIGLDWNAYLLEPGAEAYMKLALLHEFNDKVKCFPLAIGTHDGVIELHVNEPHISGDTGLLSTTVPSEKERWGSLKFKPQQAECMRFKTFMELIGDVKFDFITIDCEGMDMAVLSQIDLTDVKMICVEWNGKDKEKYVSYCEKFGMKVHHVNSENIILVR